MSETQNIEWKKVWRDEFLKWICGFANANGGMLEIGKDDKGNVVGLSDALLIKKLRLQENKYLKRAALLLFHPDPEQFFTGAFVKIGYFRTPSDLRFQDVIHGYLFEQVEKNNGLVNIQVPGSANPVRRNQPD